MVIGMEEVDLRLSQAAGPTRAPDISFALFDPKSVNSRSQCCPKTRQIASYGGRLVVVGSCELWICSVGTQL